MKKGRKSQAQKWTLPEWMMLHEWMTKHEEKGTPWDEREKLWAQEHGIKRSTQALRGAWNRWKWGWRPKRLLLETPEELCSSISITPADTAPEDQHDPFHAQADSPALRTGSSTPTQNETPQLSRLQRRNRRRRLSRQFVDQLYCTLEFCVMATS
ncbi:hypothetical protein BJX66DRAFT_116388 [Aspergillus keveii]|uniref:Myb-like domain-containing protein n=1 Tax=Aspergillus keveii TaxID=714993 RepID=A0ABR4FKA6_9EURO